MRLVLCLAAACVAAAPASAAFITYEFSGTVYSAGVTPPPAVGDSFSGTLTFNTAATLSFSGPTFAGFNPDAAVRMSVTVGGTTFSTASIPAPTSSFNQIFLNNDSGSDPAMKLDRFLAEEFVAASDGVTSRSVLLNIQMVARGSAPTAITSLNLADLILDPTRFPGDGGPGLYYQQTTRDIATGNTIASNEFFGRIEAMSVRSDAVATPAPAGLVLGGIGVMSMLGYGRLRRMGTAAA